jgi:glycosyltransferase involved in cell wall biosynthesis
MGIRVRPRPHIVMLLGNNPFPQDERVRREARSLVEAGYHVSVIAPHTTNQPKREAIQGVDVYRYDSHVGNRSVVGYMFAYLSTTLTSLFLTLRLLIRPGLDAVHAHNPPDTFVLVGALMRLLGKRYVFDQHDLAPELYEATFGEKARRSVYAALALLEKASCRLADHVLVTNESYKRVDIERARIPPTKVTVVRNGPDSAPIAAPASSDIPKGSARIAIGYLGIMGYHDGVDHALRALDHLIRGHGISDVQLILIGDGVARAELEGCADKLKLQEHVMFTGFLEEANWRTVLGDTDICIVPDPSNSYNDRSTMVKIMDYMALGKPIVAFDLPESRFTAGDAAVFVPGNDELAFARALADLIEDPERRAALGKAGRERVENELMWSFSARSLVQVYESLLGAPEASGA